VPVGVHKAEREERREGYYRIERSSGAFSRSLTLPEGVDPQQVRASFDRGVLEVHVPKPEARKPQKIEISVSRGDTVEAEATESKPESELAGAAA